MRALAHYTNYCKACDRRFGNDNELRMVSISLCPLLNTLCVLNLLLQHLNSKTHRGNNVPCPFCNKAYTTATGVVHHLESGSCLNAPKLNRETILDIVRSRDPAGVITNKQIEWHEERSVTYEAGAHAFNGFAWECYICHSEFRMVSALNAHLNSARHKEKVYHCPNANNRCGKQFVNLAGLFNHLESEACAFMRFEKVQQNFGDVLQGQRRIAFS